MGRRVAPPVIDRRADLRRLVVVAVFAIATGVTLAATIGLLL